MRRPSPLSKSSHRATITSNSNDRDREEGDEEEGRIIGHKIARRRRRGTTCDVAPNSVRGGSSLRGSVIPRWMLLVGATTTAIAFRGAGAYAGGATAAFVPSGFSSVGRRVFGTSSSHRCVFRKGGTGPCGNHRPFRRHSGLDIRRFHLISSSLATQTTRLSGIRRQLLDSARLAAGGGPRLEGYLSCVSTEFGDSHGEESLVGTEVAMTSSPNMDPASTVDESTPSDDAAKNASAATTTRTRARRVPSTAESISECGERLRRGDLVAFPTETVYGLGCDALSRDAALKIFAAKERPYTDPLISHVASADDAFDLWSTGGAGTNGDGGEDGTRVLRALTDRFWPGPLTLVYDASPKVPPIVTANTGRSAVRCPSHPLARALIKEAGVPVAAPSANKFGHVSPTRADHVLDDLGDEDVWVVDPDMVVAATSAVAVNGDGGSAEDKSSSPCCRVGVESTVALVDADSRTVSVLRHGAVSPGDIRDCLTAAGVVGYRVVDVKKQEEEASERGRGRPPPSEDSHDRDDGPRDGGVGDVAATEAETTIVVGDVSPGQTVRHYSPHVPSFLISSDRYNHHHHHYHRNDGEEVGMSSPTNFILLRPGEEETLRRAVVIDFGGRLSFVRDRCLAYRDLSPGGSSEEAASRVFEYLRWTESVDGAERVYFPEIVSSPSSFAVEGGEEEDEDEDALTLALRDRLTRAASAVVTDDFC